MMYLKSHFYGIIELINKRLRIYKKFLVIKEPNN